MAFLSIGNPYILVQLTLLGRLEPSEEDLAPHAVLMSPSLQYATAGVYIPRQHLLVRVS